MKSVRSTPENWSLVNPHIHKPGTRHTYTQIFQSCCWLEKTCSEFEFQFRSSWRRSKTHPIRFQSFSTMLLLLAEAISALALIEDVRCKFPAIRSPRHGCQRSGSEQRSLCHHTQHIGTVRHPHLTTNSPIFFKRTRSLSRAHPPVSEVSAKSLQVNWALTSYENTCTNTISFGNQTPK